MIPPDTWSNVSSMKVNHPSAMRKYAKAHFDPQLERGVLKAEGVLRSIHFSHLQLVALLTTHTCTHLHAHT